jgi:YidC/Oxa1 family membrane protein insertase
MKVAQPAMQKRVKEVQGRYKDDPAKLQEEMSKVYKEFGNPFAGCFPVLLQMPILFALFATLRGSPFADVSYPVNVQVFPQEKVEQIQPQAFSTSTKNIYITDGVHYPMSVVIPGGNKLSVGEKTDFRLQTNEGRTLPQLVQEQDDAAPLSPYVEVTKGQELVNVNNEDQSIEAIAPGDVTLQVKVPGLASNKGFLFIKALGRVGVRGDGGEIHWDILLMVLTFGVSLYVNQLLSGQGSSGASDNPQQAAVNKFTPIIFSGMFLFFPLPAGVLMYMVIANIFQTLQSFILSREPLPENLQKIVDAEQATVADNGRQTLPFEPGSKKKAESGSPKKKAESKGSKKKKAT